MARTKRLCLLTSVLLVSACAGVAPSSAPGPGPSPAQPRPVVGAYYFDGWAGQHTLAGQEPWASNAPTHLSRRLLEEFPEREPVWGWRDDQLAIMERQIDWAADHGIAFFAFCWYWHPVKQQIDADPKHTGLNLFLRARNRQRMRFCLLVANHAGFLIGEAANWQTAAQFWLPYLTHPLHLRVGGQPLLLLFNPKDAQGLRHLQTAATQAGLPGLAIAGCGGGELQQGFTHRTHYNIVPGHADGSRERPYQELVAAHKKAWSGARAQPYIPVVTAGWDMRPWEGPRGLNNPATAYFPDRTPEGFGDFVRSAIQWMDQHPEHTTPERLLLIYAWNEFGEGGYLAPTKGDPEGRYLKALKAAIE